MEVTGCHGPETAEEIALDLQESDDYSFIYVYYVDGRWLRGKWVIPDAASWLIARDSFWVDMRSEGYQAHQVKLAAVLQGNVAMIDDAQYGDDPGFDPGELARYAASTQPLRHFTVFEVWHCNSPDFVATVIPVEAVDWLHAELIAREHRQDGEFYVCGVANLWVPTLDNDVFGRYATPDGEAPAPTPEPVPHRGWRGLFGH